MQQSINHVNTTDSELMELVLEGLKTASNVAQGLESWVFDDDGGGTPIETICDLVFEFAHDKAYMTGKEPNPPSWMEQGDYRGLKAPFDTGVWAGLGNRERPNRGDIQYLQAKNLPLFNH